MLSRADAQVLCVAAFYCAMPWTGCYSRCPKQLLVFMEMSVMLQWLVEANMPICRSLLQCTALWILSLRRRVSSLTKNYMT